jgi:hypothetical protein
MREGGWSSTTECPACGADVNWRRAPSALQCESCGRWLTLRPSTSQRLITLAILTASFIADESGLQQLEDLSTITLFVMAVVHVIAAALSVRLFKPQIELRDGVSDVVPRPLIPVDAAPPLERLAVEELPTITGSRRMFQLKDPAPTLEGIGIAVIAIVVGGSQAFAHAEPAIARIYPEFHATRSGPSAFPITVHIGRD